MVTNYFAFVTRPPFIFTAEKYVREVLKLYGKNPDDILIHNDISQIANFSLIHGETG